LIHWRGRKKKITRQCSLFGL